MRLKVLGSNSQGNCYILENETDALLIECGMPMKDIKAGIDFRIAKIDGCVLTHEHGDHAKSVKDVLNAGIPVYATRGTGEACGILAHHGFNRIDCGGTFIVGPFKVVAFQTKHDAAEPCCFLIHHPDCGNVLFLTDTYYTEYTFRGLNQVIIEANYCQQIIDDKLAASGGARAFLRDRILESHMSLATCKKTLRANDLREVRNIVLIHLSDSNSDAARFQREIAAVTGKPVHVADRGLIIEDFTKQPF